MLANRIGTLALLVFSHTSIAGGQQALNSSDAFDRLKALEGSWSISNGRSGMQREATFRSGAGNILILDEGGQLTVFHLDKDRLSLTHYCGTGNQPRMRMRAADDRTIVFTMYDITNLSSPKAYHTSGLEVVFLSNDRVHLQYRGTTDGRESTQTVQLTRKKS
jgi:hypothetical protein